MGTVSVDKVAQALRISERKVQRLVIDYGMPRDERGKYNLAQCMIWYIRHLHQKVCGCAGPCDGFESGRRNTTNAKAERKKALAEVRDIAPKLVGLDAEAIKKRLMDAVKQTYDDFELAREEE